MTNQQAKRFVLKQFEGRLVEQPGPAGIPGFVLVYETLKNGERKCIWVSSAINNIIMRLSE